MPESAYTIDSEQVRANLLAALEFILGYSGYSDFANLTAETHRNLVVDQIGALSRAYSRLKSASAKEYYSNIPQIEIPFSDTKLEHHNPTILIGGLICCNDGVVKHSSFSLCVTFNSNSVTPLNNNTNVNTDSCCLVHFGHAKIIVRRFHFDHQPYEGQRPPSHIQYGGNFPGITLDATGWHYCLDNSVDNPRLNYFPMDFVLVLDFAVRDFDTPLSSLAKEPDWNDLVQKSQQIWWRDYLNWLKANVCDRDDRILHDIIYN